MTSLRQSKLHETQLRERNKQACLGLIETLPQVTVEGQWRMIIEINRISVQTNTQ